MILLPRCSFLLLPVIWLSSSGSTRMRSEPRKYSASGVSVANADESEVRGETWRPPAVYSSMEKLGGKAGWGGSISRSHVHNLLRDRPIGIPAGTCSYPASTFPFAVFSSPVPTLLNAAEAFIHIRGRRRGTPSVFSDFAAKLRPLTFEPRCHGEPQRASKPAVGQEQ